MVILGATGTGKTYLSCALGIAANRKYYTTRYIRLPDLLVEIALARGGWELQRRDERIPQLQAAHPG